MHLCIDIGNTKAKLAVFDSGDTMVEYWVYLRIGIRKVSRIIKSFNISKVILSSTRNLKISLVKGIRKLAELIVFDHLTPIPVSNSYDTPETLGKDRLAAVIAADKIFPGESVLVVDIGTCITYDLINHQKEYLGGNISPGWMMRIQAMHRYTDKLPLVEKIILRDMIGKSTVKALQNGSFYGTKGEIESFIRQFDKKFNGLKVVFTGGDAQLFADHMESKIFVRPHLVLEGLNEILKYNAA